MTLYEINEALRNALNSIDPETGEILTDLDELSIQRTDKIEGIALSIKNDLALVDAIKEEAKALLKRADIIANSIEWRKQYLTNALTHEDGMEKFSTPRVGISFRRTEKVQIADAPGFIAEHPNYCATKIDVRPDLTLIKRDIKNGCEISGAVVVERQSIQIK